ncbi:hypothetical protein THASP1DRAFT_25473 [Thamnocephalis sphaerospora]|uniref:Uncharacterized protein n=1 Tax=Thamnocephalis sphaerospora TaxID=78915 RepID=A0A4P9XK71_9FUNG|nr:hypothetical protein THASP1DRAFT_25473 [Thamnocephalis sphaerospora]|eukprot:RKP06152.1 hypothetical protein THASP1DRAFT_25473 [Thamnocephalis sphaerospora]
MSSMDMPGRVEHSPVAVGREARRNSYDSTWEDLQKRSKRISRIALPSPEVGGDLMSEFSSILASTSTARAGSHGGATDHATQLPTSTGYSDATVAAPPNILVTDTQASVVRPLPGAYRFSTLSNGSMLPSELDAECVRHEAKAREASQARVARLSRFLIPSMYFPDTETLDTLLSGADHENKEANMHASGEMASKTQNIVEKRSLSGRASVATLRDGIKAPRSSLAATHSFNSDAYAKSAAAKSTPAIKSIPSVPEIPQVHLTNDHGVPNQMVPGIPQPANAWSNNRNDSSVGWSADVKEECNGQLKPSDSLRVRKKIDRLSRFQIPMLSPSRDNLSDALVPALFSGSAGTVAEEDHADAAADGHDGHNADTDVDTDETSMDAEQYQLAVSLLDRRRTRMKNEQRRRNTTDSLDGRRNAAVAEASETNARPFSSASPVLCTVPPPSPVPSPIYVQDGRPIVHAEQTFPPAHAQTHLSPELLPTGSPAAATHGSQFPQHLGIKPPPPSPLPLHQVAANISRSVSPMSPLPSEVSQPADVSSTPSSFSSPAGTSLVPRTRVRDSGSTLEDEGVELSPFSPPTRQQYARSASGREQLTDRRKRAQRFADLYGEIRSMDTGLTSWLHDTEAKRVIPNAPYASKSSKVQRTRTSDDSEATLNDPYPVFGAAPTTIGRGASPAGFTHSPEPSVNSHSRRWVPISPSPSQLSVASSQISRTQPVGGMVFGGKTRPHAYSISSDTSDSPYRSRSMSTHTVCSISTVSTGANSSLLHQETDVTDAVAMFLADLNSNPFFS